MAISFLSSIQVTGTTSVSSISNDNSTYTGILVWDGSVLKYRTKSQILGDIGAGTGDGSVTSVTVTGSNGLSGTGTVTSSGTITLTNSDRGSSQNIFKNVAVSGQSTVVADSNNDTLTFVAQGGMTITTNATNDQIIFNSSDNNDNNYLSSATFNTTNGVLTLNRSGLSAVTVDLDGRYVTSSGVTSIATTNGITGGTITSTGTLQVDSTVVRTTGAQTIAGEKTFTNQLAVDTAGGSERMRLFNENGTAPIADSFSGNTSKSYIYFDTVSGSNDPGYIMHESSATETNEGVLHLVPTDDNSSGDYVSIHGTNDPDVIKLHTSGLIETVNLQLQIKSGIGAVYVNDDLIVQTDLTVSGGDITLGGTGRIQGVDTVSASTDAANKAYVDNKNVGVTSVATGDGLTGGTITSTGTISVDYTANGLIADAPGGTGSPHADDNSSGDYVSIHGTNDPDVIKLHTSGLIETVNLQLQIKSGIGAVYVNDDLIVQTDLTVSGGDITLGGTGRIQGVDTVSASTDAANKAYVDNKNVGVTSVATGDGLTGGTITSTGTISVDYTANGLIADAPGGTGSPHADDYILVGLDSSGSGETVSYAIVDLPFTNNNGTVYSVATGTGLTGGTITTTGTIELATAGIGAGTYGSTNNNTKIDQITVDAYGRITAITTGGTGRVDTVSTGNANTITVSGTSTSRSISANTGAVSSSSSNLATGAQIQSAIDSAVTGVLKYQGTWNANTNTPTLTSGSGTPGYYYIVSTNGSTNLDGITDWKVGDWAVFSDQATDAWQKIDNTQVGNVTGSGSSGRVTFWNSSSNITSHSQMTYNSVSNVLTVNGHTSDQWTSAYDNMITTATVTGSTTKTLTLNQQDGGTVTASWTDNNTNYYLSSASFNTTNGVLTLNRSGLSAVTVDLDGRYNPTIGTDTDINTSGYSIIDQINMTDGVITSTGARNLLNVHIEDTRAAEKTPNDYQDKALSLDFTDEFGSLGSWWSGITMKGWADNYQAWQLISGSDTSADNKLYFRTGIGTTWGTMYEVYHTGNLPAIPTVYNNSITISAGTNLSGGGTFTLNQNFNETVTINMATGGVGAGTYGSTSNSTKIDTITVDAYGRVTAVATGGTGDITGVTAGAGLSGGGTSGTPTISADYASGIIRDANTGGTIDGKDEIIYYSVANSQVEYTSVGNLPFTNNANNFVSSVSFNTTNGILTLNRSGLTALTVDLDGRYLTSASNYYLNGITKSGNTLTFSVSGATNQTYTFGSNAFNSTTIPTNNNQLTNGAGYTTNNGTVTGTATTGWIPKMDSSSDIGTSSLKQNSSTEVWVGSSGYLRMNEFGTLTIGNNYMGSTPATIFPYYTNLYINPGATNRTIVLGAPTSYTTNLNVMGNVSANSIDLDDNEYLYFGTSNDVEFFCNGSHMYMDLNSGIGNFYIRDGSTTRFTFNDNGNFTATGNITAYSDERLKENIETLDGSKVLEMRGVSYTKEGKESSGVIAQELEKVAPELVETADDEMGTKSVAYGNLVGYLIEAVKDQQKQIDELKAKLESYGS